MEEDVMSYVDKCTYQMKDNKPGEGIVIKRYDYVNPYGRITWAKVVRSAFKIAHKAKLPMDVDSIEEKIWNDLCTPEFIEKEQKVVSAIHRLAKPDSIEIESDLALIAVVGRGMKSTRGTAGRIFSALAHAHVNVRMIDQGSSELNIIIGVENKDFETALQAIYDIFVLTQL